VRQGAHTQCVRCRTQRPLSADESLRLSVATLRGVPTHIRQAERVESLAASPEASGVGVRLLNHGNRTAQPGSIMPPRSSHTMKTFHSIADKYYFVWAFAMPVTSYSLFPSIQGTTVGYMMCFLSLPVVLLYGGTDRRRYINFMLAALLIWVFMLFTTQLSDAATSFEPDLTKVRTFVMRSSLFTQSLYLAAVVLYVGYVYIFYKPTWDRWLLAAATLFALYGIYEVVYFLLTGQAGDFVSNRRFGQNLGADISDTFSGSAFQTIDIKGITVQRLKSLTGEPSMYALSMFPFWVYFNARAKSRLPVWIIGASLIMSTSSTALIGYLCYLAIRVRKLGFDPIKATITVLVLLVIAIQLYGGDQHVAGRNRSQPVVRRRVRLYSLYRSVLDPAREHGRGRHGFRRIRRTVSRVQTGLGAARHGFAPMLRRDWRHDDGVGAGVRLSGALDLHRHGVRAAVSPESCGSARLGGQFDER
jgi:hypothetical protein